MLVGRRVERERLEQLLDQARAGRAGALVLCGDPGVGKSMLLSWCQGRATGMRVLRAHGVEADRQLAFAGLFELTRSITPLLDEISTHQAAALRGALGLGPPVADSRFLVAGGTLNLLAAAADRDPLLLLVDDLQWLDEPSAGALLFAARRLLAEPVAMVFALRDGSPDAFETGIAELRLAGLSRDEARELLWNVERRSLSRPVEDRLYDLTAGNPLGLVELVNAVEPEVLAGRAPLQEPLPVGRRLEEAFTSRAQRLSTTTQQALLLATASGIESAARLQRVLTAAGLDMTALTPAEDTQLISLGPGGVRFGHPLIRSAIYHSAPGPERRWAHAIVASCCDEGTDELAWHLASAAAGVDERVAMRLEQTAQRASERSGFATAAAALERAATLSDSETSRARRLVTAARAASLAGQTDRARGLLLQATPLGDDMIRGDALALQGHLAHLGGEAEARRLLEEAAALVKGSDPDRGVTILADAFESCLFRGEDEALVSIAQQLAELAAADDDAQQFLAHLTMSTALMTHGRRNEGIRHASRALELAESGSLDFTDPHYLGLTAIAPATLGRLDVARSVAHKSIARLRHLGALGALPFALRFAARIDLQLGHWRDAFVMASEALDAARETDQAGQLCDCLGILAFVEAVQGRQELCRTHANQAIERAKSLGMTTFHAHAENALGLLELGVGRPAGAVEHFERVLALTGHAQVGAFQIAAADLIEAYLQLGETERAQALYLEHMAPFEDDSNRVTHPPVDRCRALLAADETFEVHCRRSLSDAQTGHQPFEAARVHFVWGSRLRRLGERRNARTQLRAAKAIFETLDALPWAERAAKELRAVGGQALMSFRVHPDV